MYTTTFNFTPPAIAFGPLARKGDRVCCCILCLDGTWRVRPARFFLDLQSQLKLLQRKASSKKRSTRSEVSSELGEPAQKRSKNYRFWRRPPQRDMTVSPRCLITWADAISLVVE